ncbi:MAG TPA: phosphoribosyltransferase family protein [Candidatus Paceibacterota bacterium]|jgi:predicted amidophosphoribosyltransferase|nr:phosphoribosyltransferase family protein [Candidatus Paceibacterota bacterium]
MSRNFLSSLFDLILPPRKTEALVADLTLADLQQLKVGDSLPYHADEVEALVWELKYYGNKHAASLAGELVAEDLLAIAAEELGQPLLLPVPMHYSRLSERGHNQTELLCEAALEALSKNASKNSRADVSEEGRPEDFFDVVLYVPDALKRTTNTPHQQGLERSLRLRNVKGSMEGGRDAHKVRGRVCVVVDDVTTTGATLAEATRALKALGARRVHCIALAQS